MLGSAGVGDRHDGVIASGRFLRPRRGPERHVAGRDGNHAAFGHRVARVDRQVEQHEFDLRRVGERGRQIGRRPHGDVDRRADRAAQQLRHAGDHPVEVGRRRVHALLAREGEQLSGEAGAPLGGGERRGQEAPIARSSSDDEPRLEQFDIADDRGQQIVEIMRDAGGQLTDRLDTLRLAQLRLGRLALLDLRGEAGDWRFPASRWFARRTRCSRVSLAWRMSSISTAVPSQ